MLKELLGSVESVLTDYGVEDVAGIMKDIKSAMMESLKGKSKEMSEDVSEEPVEENSDAVMAFQKGQKGM